MKKALSIIALAAMLMAAANSHALTIVTGDITSSTTWSGEVLLEGPIFVKAPATLTIQAGSVIYGQKSSLATLIIERGAKIQAIGTETNPIVFTSDQPVASRQRADWGGLVINGYSTLNVPGGTKIGEGSTGTFGCSGADCNEADNSGTLQYVREEYSGIQFTPDNELNGIAFQGVGSGTTVDHIHIAYSKDDCMEFFGGTVNVKYILLTACGDDMLDWTDGWRGKGQFIVAQQKGDECNNGIEADNLDKANDNLPRSNPTLYNMTFIGPNDPSSATGTGVGMLLRRGTAGKIRNAIVMGFNQTGIDLNDTATFDQATAGTLVVDNNIFFNNTATNFAADTATFMGTTMLHNEEVDPLLGAPYNLTAPDFRPGSGSPATNGTVPVAAPPSDGFFTQVNFIGGVDPNNDWTRRVWTKYGLAAWTTPVTTTTTVAATTTTTVAATTTTSIAATTTTTPASTTTTTVSNEPCPAQKLLGEDNPKLQNLRDFRDSSLAQSAVGRRLIDIYYGNAAGINAALESSPLLRNFAGSVLEMLAPMLGNNE